MPPFRFSFFALLLAAGFSAPFANAATTLNDAYSLWLFDAADSGAATFGQIIDSNTNLPAAKHNATAASNNLSWVTVPATGPYGGAAVNTTRGLKFTPTVTNVVTGSASGNEDTITAAHFTATGTVAGNSTIMTRFKWDGQISTGGLTSDDFGYQWMVNNGYGASQGYMMGINSTSASPNTGMLNYFTYLGTGVTSPASTTGANGFTITSGKWYDLAMIVNTGGDADLATGTVTFVLVEEGGIYQQAIRTGVHINTAIGTNMVIGSEGTGSGTGNNRKSFNGTMDYLAVFNSALSIDDVKAIMIPEPSRGLLLTSSLMLLLLQRKRRSAIAR